MTDQEVEVQKYLVGRLIQAELNRFIGSPVNQRTLGAMQSAAMLVIHKYIEEGNDPPPFDPVVSITGNEVNVDWENKK